ncbi:hypothetical protein J3E64_003785 [Sphingobium sp. OAS761]|nr:hypothetical protein [Sphingobium sp. OAS761]MCP1472070.1 hypothetical protein [Sphingobium sp. OAS761]
MKRRRWQVRHLPPVAAIAVHLFAGIFVALSNKAPCEDRVSA